MSDTIKIDGVVYSEDKKVLIKYSDEINRERFYIPDFVEEIGIGCFSDTDYTRHIIIGKNVRKIRDRALGDQFKFVIKQIYIPSTVTELEGEIFDCGVDDGGDYYSIEIVGGERGSVIEGYCNERGIPFVVFESSAAESFYSLSVDELKDLARRQIEAECDGVVNENEKSYQIKFSADTLEFLPLSNTTEEIIITKTRMRLNKFRRNAVKTIIIGDGITGIDDFAFDDYENLEAVFLGADVSKISSMAFTGREKSDSWGCPKLSSFAVDENNKGYRAIDGVLYTLDRQTIVTYPPAKPDLYYEIDPCVKNIGAEAFKRANNLQCLKVGEKCETIGDFAFLNAFSLKHVYFANKAIKWPERFPFIEMVGYDRPYRLGIIFGGPEGSEVKQKCSDEEEYFLVIDNNGVKDFLSVPVPKDSEDKYMQECLKEMIISKNGTLEQVGEFGDELILPEGVVSTRYHINLSKCKKVVIPSTMKRIWAEGFDGPAPDLKEFTVSPENTVYNEIGGHLCSSSTLITYVPGTEKQGVIPEGILDVAEYAFRLIPAPIEKLYVPSSLKHICPQRVFGGWFSEAEVSPENIDLMAIDGSIYSKDGKKIVHAKISKDGFVVPEGTEIISEGALSDVHGSVTIPASVKKIKDVYGFGRNVKKLITPKGSYAEWHVTKNGYSSHIEIVYDGEDESWDPDTAEENEEWPLSDFPSGFSF